MEIKEYDKLTSAGEILLDLFCGFGTVVFARVLRRQTHIPEKRRTALQPHARQRLMFVMVFYPSLLFSPFGTYLWEVL